MKKLLLLLTMILLVSCQEKAVSIGTTNNPKINVELLFTYDSIKVYRFQDGGRTHYFTKNQTMSTQKQGKNSYYEETIPNQ